MTQPSLSLAFNLGGPEILIILVLLLGGAVAVAAVVGLGLRLSKRGTSRSLAPTPPLSAEVDDGLRRLAKLKEDGVITDAEFEAKKQALLRV
ncbi:MAG: SHOCT domain-containing protein [Verrucomicrobiales bacterium]